MNHEYPKNFPEEFDQSVSRYPQKKIYEVSEIALELKSVIEKTPGFQEAWIRGETSRVTYHSSGHLYFSLKDSKSVINAVMWRTQVQRLKFQIKEGLSVLVQGNLTTFPARSNYQVQVLDVIPEGVGKLQQQIEQLKIALIKEGIFQEGRKQKLPVLPKCVGVVTSPTGAALRDIVRVLKSRYANVNILIAPCDVQGGQASASIIRALEIISNPFWEVDVIIVARGGGSLEDLMAFNEESVVRAVANSKTPVVTGIGHEIDFTLSDFAADKRGATPSQAAEIAVPFVSHFYDKIESLLERHKNASSQKLNLYSQRLQRISSHRLLQKPENYINELIQRMDSLQDRYRRVMRWKLDNYYHKIEPYKNLPEKVRSRKSEMERKFALLVEKLEGLSPLKAISRGYSYIRRKDGKIVTKRDDISLGDDLSVRIMDAVLGCKVEKIEDL